MTILGEMVDVSSSKAQTQKQLCYKMLLRGRSTVDFLNTSLCAEYRKWISIIRKEVEARGGKLEKTKISDRPRNYYYKLTEPKGQGKLL